MKLFEAIPPQAVLHKAAIELAMRETVGKYQSERLAELQLRITLRGKAYHVEAFQPGSPDHEIRWSVPAGLVERYAQVVMGREDNRAVRVGVLNLTALLLPGSERTDWLEEQRGYLADLPTRRACWGWIVAQILAMPKYAYTVRTKRERESA